MTRSKRTVLGDVMLLVRQCFGEHTHGTYSKQFSDCEWVGICVQTQTENPLFPTKQHSLREIQIFLWI